MKMTFKLDTSFVLPFIVAIQLKVDTIVSILNFFVVF